MNIDPNMQLSPRFKLRDFLVTSYSVDNRPDYEYQLTNLKNLAMALEVLISRFGAIRIESGYRSQALQDALRRDTGQAASVSLHSEGQAADIEPLAVTAQQMFAGIAADSNLKNMFGEIAVKQNIIHISTPTASKRGLLMYVDAADKYITMTADQVKTFIATYKKTTIGLALVSVFAAAGFIVYKIWKSRRK